MSTNEEIQSLYDRVAALRGFLQRAHRAVNDAGGFLGMDTFGYTTWWTDDGGIGQDLEILADNLEPFGFTKKEWILDIDSVAQEVKFHSFGFGS